MPKLSLIIFILFASFALISFFWTPFPPNHLDIPNRFLFFSFDHLLGTDHLGRDTLSRLMVATRYSVFIAFVSVTIGCLIGSFFGLISGSYLGIPDKMIHSITTVSFAFPALLVAILLSSFNELRGIKGLILAISFFNIPIFVRMVRGKVKSLWQNDFVKSSQALGKSNFLIIFHHILPNLKSLIAIQYSTQIAVAILIETGLSYLGLGISPPTPSLGRILYDSKNFMTEFPFTAFYPGLFIFLIVLAINLFSDYLRDSWDPNIKRKNS